MKANFTPLPKWQLIRDGHTHIRMANSNHCKIVHSWLTVWVFGAVRLNHRTYTTHSHTPWSIKSHNQKRNQLNEYTRNVDSESMLPWQRTSTHKNETRTIYSVCTVKIKKIQIKRETKEKEIKKRRRKKKFIQTDCCLQNTRREK